MFTPTSLRGLLRPLSSSTTQSTTSQNGLLAGILRATAAASTTTTPTSSPLASSPASPRGFSTTPASRAKPVPQKGGKKAGGGKPLDPAAARAARKKRKSQMEARLDPKIAGLMKFLYAGSQVQAPLRMARNRWLRHWTIHRAWALFRRRQEEEAEREMMRMQQSMAHACETLRNMGGPGTRPEGWLYRKAMEKKGVWGKDAVPIEYARPMVETPGNRPWNHEWKRS